MERRFQIRLDELLADAVVPDEVARGVMPRLEAYLVPFVAALRTPEQKTNAQQYVAGLLSDLKSKDAESIAYLHDRERKGIQAFLGESPWDHRPLLTVLAQEVATELGEPDGVLVFDPSAFAKKGTESVGVQRQWCGRLGKVENCQVGIYLGYVSRRGDALVDFRLYLPKEWTRRRRRCRKAGVPDEVTFQTRHELILDMLDERGPQLPHAWIAGDDELGRSSWFREHLRRWDERYLLAVPSNTLIRDLSAPLPEYAGQGRPSHGPFVRVDRWCAALPEDAWRTIAVRDGEQGPLEVQAVRRLVQARTEGQPSEEAEILVVLRERQRDGTWKHDYALGWAEVDTPLEEWVRVYKAEHRIEESLKRAKSEAGLADYQVRTWDAWHRHQALSLIATWFLTKEARRGKNTDARTDGAPGARADRWRVEPSAPLPSRRLHPPQNQPTPPPQRASTILSLETPQSLAAQKV